jgi:hypothetical protein
MWLNRNSLNGSQIIYVYIYYNNKYSKMHKSIETFINFVTLGYAAAFFPQLKLSRYPSLHTT